MEESTPLRDSRPRGRSLKRYLAWGVLFWGLLATAVFVALMEWIADLPRWRVILIPLACFVVAGIIWGFLAWLLRPRHRRS